MSDFGLWKSCSSDNGAEFRNSLMQKISETLGIDQRYLIPFHARSRGAVENTVKTTMQVLRKFVNYSYNDWSDFLPATQLAINYKIRLKTASSAFSLMFARKLNDFKDYKTKDKHGNCRTLSHEELEERIEKMASIVFPAINERTQKILDMQKAKFDKNNKLIDIDIGSAVMIKLEKRPVNG